MGKACVLVENYDGRAVNVCKYAIYLTVYRAINNELSSPFPNIDSSKVVRVRIWQITKQIN